MRVLFNCHPDAQHLYPLVPLAWAMRAGGHEVRIAASPASVPAIVHTGLTAVPVGPRLPPPTSRDDADTLAVLAHREFPPDWPLHTDRLDDGHRTVLELLGRRSAAFAEYLADDLVGYARFWRPDLVVHDVAAFAGAVAAAATGVPNIRFLTGVGLRPMETRVGRGDPIPEYAALFESRGLRVRMPPTLTVDPSPPTLRLPVPAPWRGVRYVPYNGPGVAPPWLRPDTGRTRICVTSGLSLDRVTRRLGPATLEPFQRAIEALCELDVEVILTTTAHQLEVIRQLLGGLPPRVRAVESVPLHLLLPYCALIVHQAGDGTALTAAAAGTAQLAITRKPDPALTGGRLAAAGVGIHLRYQELEGQPDARETIRAAAEKVLTDPGYAAAAARLRAEIDTQPPPATLAGELAALARDRRG